MKQEHHPNCSCRFQHWQTSAPKECGYPPCKKEGIVVFGQRLEALDGHIGSSWWSYCEEHRPELHFSQ